MMKKLFYFLVLVIIFIQPSSALAESIISTCDNNSYCKDGQWHRKSNCMPSAKLDAGECECDDKLEGRSCNQANPNKDSSVNNALGVVDAPKAVAPLGGGEAGINNLLGKVVQLIFVVATVGFVFMVLISAVQLILSGGDKEALGKARGRLTWAIIGIVLLSLSFVIFRVLENITGFSFTL